ncbi:hypothetical protein C4K03_1261 [Pseudomonas synxantha]|uniref:Uncharacterized protein n=1 Tax=Pseudomonas synxantha TaxID=47883 RepID=A0A3G7U457_9PSED|nr:hypothetical protein [Pseudomonas synxantha]AZE53432.1 hypothetical protein C4K03_1261 [Pseudomonas synxantha]
MFKNLKDYWRCQAEWWKRQSFEWWAKHFTAAYVGVMLLIMGAKFEELLCLKLNEIGDFLAGSFGPPAFLWLVLGYIQQGRELRLSSDALNLQAAELKHAVEQQTKIAEATIAQTDAANRALAHQMAEADRAQSASFEFLNPVVQAGRPGFRRCVFELHNHGANAYNVIVSMNPKISTLNEVDQGTIKRNDHADIALEIGKTVENIGGVCTISYLGGDRKARTKKLDFRLYDEARIHFSDKPDEPV